MSEIKAFNSLEFGQIRTTSIDGEPWFVGKDIAAALGYKNISDALIKHVDMEDKGVAKCDTLCGNQEMTVINESGMYSLVLSSRRSEEHTSELQSRQYLVCRLLLEKKKE